MKNYRSSMWWDETGLEWRNPSPNIRDLDAALLYPGTVFFEATNVNEGLPRALTAGSTGVYYYIDIYYTSIQ